MHRPVSVKYKIVQDFGETDLSRVRGSEIYAFFDGKHPGFDFSLPVGEPVSAALSGYVTSIEYHRGMGKVIRMRSGNIQHIYAHLDSFGVDFGQYVEEGVEIAKSGDTVSWTGPHLHFEVRDLTVWEVKDRPFRPDFRGRMPKNFEPEFVYTVSRDQALIDLALKFFGIAEGVGVLTRRNPTLSQMHSHEALPIGCRITIPQFIEKGLNRES